MPATAYARNAWLDGTTAMPSTLFLQQHTAEPDAFGEGFEAADCRSGSRKMFTRSAAVNGLTANLEILETTVTVTETYAWFSVWDSNVGGNCWFTGPWIQPRTYSPGNVARVQSGNVDLALT